MTHKLGDDTLSVPTEELWLKAIDENIPFHKFHDWVTMELTKRYIAAQMEARLNGERIEDLRQHRRDVLSSVNQRKETSEPKRALLASNRQEEDSKKDKKDKKEKKDKK